MIELVSMLTHIRSRKRCRQAGMDETSRASTPCHQAETESNTLHKPTFRSWASKARSCA